jgi:putative endonuclease
VYVESTENALAAIEREKQLKGWKREKKIALIVSQNPGWRDLTDQYSE